MQEMYRLR